jgi:Fe-S oxidoreductase
MVTTYHDPCNYGRKSQSAFGHGYFEEGRFITSLCCSKYVEMTPNRNLNFCCGAGGGLRSMPFQAEQVYHGRMKARQIQETGAELVIASCQTCRDQLLKTLKPEFDLDIQVKYLWELVADSLVMPPVQVTG